MAEAAGRADALVAFVPEASMGTAIEIWEAYRHQRPIFIISPLRENWVIRFLSTRVFETHEEFIGFVASGEFQRAIQSQSPP